MNTAACDDGHITILADKEIIVYRLGKSGLTDNHGDMHTFPLCAVSYMYVYTRLILLCLYLYMLGGTPAGSLTVCSYIICSCRYLMQSRNLCQQVFLNLIHYIYLSTFKLTLKG